MANPYIWAGLERATNDPTTIDQAIAEGVAAHNDDPDAHLGPGQALESHRAAEIIDHLVLPVEVFKAQWTEGVLEIPFSAGQLMIPYIKIFFHFFFINR